MATVDETEKKVPNDKVKKRRTRKSDLPIEGDLRSHLCFNLEFYSLVVLVQAFSFFFLVYSCYHKSKNDATLKFLEDKASKYWKIET